MTISSVRSRRDLAEFVDLPWRLYRGDPNWIPPLKASVRAMLDASRVTPDFEQFSLPELIHDVVQEFELQARQKGVTLEVDAAPEACMVHADIGLIQRVAAVGVEILRAMALLPARRRRRGGIR